jgi:hypothetical protein
MNQWVRDALAHTNLTGPDIAAGLTRMLSKNYDKSMVQKMTVFRKVSKAEAEAISALTGYPLTPDALDPYAIKMAQLPATKRRLVEQLIDTLQGEQKAEPQ